MKPPASRCAAFGALPWIARANAALLCAAMAALAALLWPAWKHDDNMAHGIFLPFLAVILVVESRREPGSRFAPVGAWPAAVCAALMSAALASFAVAIGYAAQFGWSHSMAQFALAAALVLALGAAWLGFADPRVRFLPLNWPAAVAVGVWLFASPPPPGTYARLAFHLQALVTDGVVRVLNLFSVAAYQDGNVIVLAHGSVGVSEACSGVRSLISCTVAGLFLSAVLVRRPAYRLLVILLSPAIGLGMNFLRSLVLTVLVNSGVDIEGRWHDITGASILACTTLLVGALALGLNSMDGARRTVAAEDPAPPPGRPPAQWIVAAGLVAAAFAAGLLAGGGRHPPPDPGRSPDLEALLPAPPPGWTAAAVPDMDQYSGTLQTHALVERVYSAGTGPQSAHLTLYLAYWRPGQAPVSLVASHTPDACWPGTGWEPRPLSSSRASLAVGGRTLAPAECRLFAHGRYETRVWYWHLYGGRPIGADDPRSPARLLALAWRYGFSRAEDQLFVSVSSNRAWEEIASQPALRQFFANLGPLGL